MKLFRYEHSGGVLFDTETLRFQITDSASDAERFLTPTLPSRRDILCAPVRVYLELTQKCNLLCKHCFVSSTRTSPDGLGKSEFITILDDFSRAGVIEIRFTGGEPTQKKNWFEIMQHAKERGFLISINTNGIYRNNAEIVRKFRFLEPSQITLSIDGSESNHDYIRGKGTFQRTLAAARDFSNAGLPVRLNTVISKRNVDDIPYLIRLASEIAKEINFFYMRPVGRAIGENHSMLDFSAHFESAKAAASERPLFPNLSIMHFEQSFTERSIQASRESGLQKALPYGGTTLGVTCDGSAWPHGYSPYQDKRLLLGSVQKDGIQAIWTNSTMLDQLRSWFQALVERCEKCPEYRSTCPGFNFEMEIAKSMGSIASNPFCVSKVPVPTLSFD
jgi:MoaA/NifB/PqqE/SkfB family radical SAM enzyme